MSVQEDTLHAGRPPQVMVAAIILLISVVIGCVFAVYMLSDLSTAYLPAGIAFASLGLIYAILKRQRWARLLLLVVSLLAAAAFAASLFHPQQESALTYTIRASQSVLRFAAIYLLFTGEARRWFLGETARP